MINFFHRRFNFSPKKGGSNQQMVEVGIARDNPSPTSKVALAITGFDIEYSGKDHHLKRCFVRAELNDFGPFGDSVGVSVTIGLRDSSGKWDDNYDGHVDLGIIVIDDDDVKVFSQSQDIPYSSGHGPQTATDFYSINSSVEDGIVLLRGFDIGFRDKDHHVLEMGLGVDGVVQPVGGQSYNAVACRAGLRDSSGFWDDAYGATLHYTALHYPRQRIVTDTQSLDVSGKGSGPESTSQPHFVQGNLPQGSHLVALRGFQVRYTAKDHHVHRMISEVKISDVTAEANRTRVTVEYTGGLRDHSGNWDDQYACQGDYALLSVPNEPKPVFTFPEWIKILQGVKVPFPLPN